PCAPRAHRRRPLVGTGTPFCGARARAGRAGAAGARDGQVFPVDGRHRRRTGRAELHRAAPGHAVAGLVRAYEPGLNRSADQVSSIATWDTARRLWRAIASRTTSRERSDGVFALSFG